MDSRTRVDHAIHRKPLDRVPRYDSFWEDTLTSWQAQGLPGNVEPCDFFDFDIRAMYLDTSMRFEQKVLRTDAEYITYQDRCGYTVRKAINKSRSMEFSDHVTTDKDAWRKHRHRFQFNAADQSRLDAASYFMHMDKYPSWQEIQQPYARLRATGRYLCYSAYGPWEATWRHRGYAPLLMDLVEDPDWVHEMAKAHNDLLIATLRHAVGLKLKPDALFLVDDLACTRGLLFSPDCWRAIFKPLYRTLGAFLRGEGISFWLHCCGNCELLLKDMIECGLEVIQPLQARSGLDVRKLKPIYGKDLTFFGNIDVSAMSGPWELCEQEVREKISCAKEGGGYMYHSDHSVPPEVTYERYRQIMALVIKYGAYKCPDS